MRTYKRIANRGFTLVELMIVVAIIGVLAALAIYGVRKYLLNAKTAEAKEGIGRLAKDAASAYDAEAMAADVVEIGQSTGITHHLCAAATKKVPSSASAIAGKKYQSQPSEWNVTGWECVKFSMRDPQYYMYQYYANGDGVDGVTGGLYSAMAFGDLNGDATLSTFALGGQIQEGASGGKVITIAPTYSSVTPEE